MNHEIENAVRKAKDTMKSKCRFCGFKECVCDDKEKVKYLNREVYDKKRRKN